MEVCSLSLRGGIRRDLLPGFPIRELHVARDPRFRKDSEDTGRYHSCFLHSQYASSALLPLGILFVAAFLDECICGNAPLRRPNVLSGTHEPPPSPYAYSQSKTITGSFSLQDWWNSCSFPEYYKKWNVIVHDWLYAFIYRDATERLTRNKVTSTWLVFIVSAIFHEFILAFTFRFCYPVLFVVFGICSSKCNANVSARHSDYLLTHSNKTIICFSLSLLHSQKSFQVCWKFYTVVSVVGRRGILRQFVFS